MQIYIHRREKIKKHTKPIRFTSFDFFGLIAEFAKAPKIKLEETTGAQDVESVEELEGNDVRLAVDKDTCDEDVCVDDDVALQKDCELSFSRAFSERGSAVIISCSCFCTLCVLEHV
jgi:hypothetical protein